MKKIMICREMHWTEKQYMETPRKFLALLEDQLEVEASEANRKKKS